MIRIAMKLGVPKVIRELLTGSLRGTIIVAGGSVRKLFFDGYVDTDTDYDFYVEDASVGTQLCNQLYLQGFRHSFESAWATTFRNESGVIAQVIRLDYSYGAGDGVRSMFDTFDLTMSQWAYDGHAVYATEEAMRDTSLKVLNVLSPRHPVSTLRRITKFCRRGFTATPQTYADVLKAAQDNPDLLKEDLLLREGADSEAPPSVATGLLTD